LHEIADISFDVFSFVGSDTVTRQQFKSHVLEAVVTPDT